MGSGAIFESVTMKTCTKCKRHKPVSEFGNDSRSRDGLLTHCRECVGRYKAAYRAKNRTRLVEQNRQHYQDNKEQRIEWQREYRANNPEALKESRRKSRERQSITNPDYAAQSAAHSALHRAVESGRVARPDTCEACRDEPTHSGHHDSYEKARYLVVCWMCIKCHAWTHAKRREQVRRAA